MYTHLESLVSRKAQPASKIALFFTEITENSSDSQQRNYIRFEIRTQSCTQSCSLPRSVAEILSIAISYLFFDVA